MLEVQSPLVYIDLDTSLMFVAKKFPKHMQRGTFYFWISLLEKNRDLMHTS